MAAIFLRFPGNFLIYLVVWEAWVFAATPPKVAIIGGGIGGTSVSYFLGELMPEAQVDLFEKSSILGGRLNVTTIFGNGYETGGSIIHPKNKYAVDLAKKFKLESRSDSGEAMSIIKDDEFVFNTSKWTIVTIIKTLARYGFEFNKMQNLINGFVQKFSRIYELQEEGKTFQTPEELLTAMDPLLLNLTRSDFRTFLKDQGFGDLFIDELVSAIAFVNYGQDLSMHSFVGSVSAAGAGSDLWSVSGGNKRLPESLLASTKAKGQLFLNTEVTQISILKDGTYRLYSSGNKDLGTYDHIVIAIPLDATRGHPIKFTDFSTLPYSYPKDLRYHRTIATVIAAHVHDKYKFRTDIISCVPNWYNSISLIHPTILVVAEKYPIYKIFSKEPVTEEQLDQVFAKREYKEVHDWLAYPEYDKIPPKFPGFVLAPKMYYLNAIEWAASAMEMSLISGKNIALMISQEENSV